jgi:hypothetical protein
MKGDELVHEETGRIGQIVRVTYTILNRVAIILFQDGTRAKVSLSDYTYNEEKKVWEIT